MVTDAHCPLLQRSVQLLWLHVSGRTDHNILFGHCVFQSCARPQYGKWISCVTTDSDWMVKLRRRKRSHLVTDH